MKNTKGMTLIEVIISLLIISTASLIIVVGFVTALNLFTDSNHYKDVTNKQQKALVDEENKDTDIDVDDTLANYSITVNESGNPIVLIKKQQVKHIRMLIFQILFHLSKLVKL